MSELLRKLEKQIEARKKKPKRKTILELFISRPRPLDTLIRGIVGLADHKLEMDYLAETRVKTPKLKPKDDYAV